MIYGSQFMRAVVHIFVLAERFAKSKSGTVGI